MGESVNDEEEETTTENETGLDAMKSWAKRILTYSLVLLIVLVNVWFITNGENFLPRDIYTQEISIVYGVILAVIMATWIATLIAQQRTHIITELYEISIWDSLAGMFLGTVIILTVFWVVFGGIFGAQARELSWEQYLALIALHGLIVAPMETITAQKMVVDMMGYIPAAIFFAGMHAAIYGLSLGSLMFAFVQGYIWSRMIGFKTDKWYYSVFGLGFVIAWHATYNIAVQVYQLKMLCVLSFAGPYAVIFAVVLLLVFAVWFLKNQNQNQERDVHDDCHRAYHLSFPLFFGGGHNGHNA